MCVVCKKQGGEDKEHGFWVEDTSCSSLRIVMVQEEWEFW